MITFCDNMPQLLSYMGYYNNHLYDKLISVCMCVCVYSTIVSLLARSETEIKNRKTFFFIVGYITFHLNLKY